MDVKRLLTQNTFYYLIIALIIVASVSFGFYQYGQRRAYNRSLTSSYGRTLHNVSGYVDDVNTLLTKVSVTKYPQQSAPIFAEIWKQAGSAHESLLDLPYNHEIVVNTLKFLSQTSDFSYAMMTKNIDGQGISDEDIEKIESLKEYSSALSSDLVDIVANVGATGDVDWDLLRDETLESGKVSSKALLGSITQVGKTFQNYPSLIYDGPFSDHIQNINPKMLEGKSAITMHEGMEIAQKFSRLEKIAYVKFIEETPEGIENTLPVYTYLVNGGPDSHDVYIDVAKHGGLPIWMLNAVDTSGEVALSTEQALALAEAFLSDNGFNSMKYSYYEVYGSNMVINFAPFIGGVIMYPDLVKIKVSLIDGSILGYEGRGYINMHHQRELPSEIMNADKARTFVSDELSITSANRAVIPKASGEEALCYEFKGKMKDKSRDKTFIVYINAVTGKMEDIFELIETENGILAE